MANNTKTNKTKTTSTKRTTSNKTSPIKEVKETTVEAMSVVPEVNIPIRANSQYLDKIDPHELIPCTNLTHGTLIYVSKRMAGYEERWDSFGAVAYIEFIELQSMARTDKMFFTENWIQIDDVRVLRQLNVDRFYKYAIDIDKFDDLFDLDIDELSKKINGMTKCIKNTVTMRAIELIENGTLDSMKKIEALENLLSCELIER